jgi:hypothetical protein
MNVFNMGISDPRTVATPVTVDWPMNEHGTMTVSVVETNEVRHLVEFAPGVAAVLADLPAGTTLPVRMRRLPARGSCWRVTAVGTSTRSR